MNKKLIRLTEPDLHKIVKESINKILNESIEEHKHLSDVADKEFYDIVAEFMELFKTDNYSLETVDKKNGVDLPVKIFEVVGYYSMDDGEANPKMDSAKSVCFFVYYLNSNTKQIYDKYVNKTSITRLDGAIKLVLYAFNGELDMKSFERAISTLPHEQIHGIQQLNSGNNQIRKNYARATTVRHSDTTTISNAERLLSRMLWYFDKKEVDANIHKFIIDYREALNNNLSDSDCEFFHQIKKMETLISTFKSFNKNIMSETLEEYGLKWGKFIKYCQHLLDYAKKRFKQVKVNVENGEYPYPNSKNKWFE